LVRKKLLKKSQKAGDSSHRPGELSEQIRQRAGRLGFGLVGICPAVRPPGVDRLDEWLQAGYAGQMGYLAERRDAYEHPRHVLDGARSVVMLGMAYRTTDPRQPQPGQGRVSRYAWGDADYHDVIRTKLHELADQVKTLRPEALTRCVVDTAPLMERDFAQLAGLGWIGKNTLLLNKPQGSWFFLSALLTDVELEYDEPFEANHCGSCTACLDACPTGAFPQPYALDATRCISYLTIELRDAVPPELRAGMGEWLFGCDVCQDVCPWNGRSPESPLAEFLPREDSNAMELAPLFALDEAEFRRRFRRTPLWRAHRRGLLRNAAIVLGNSRPPEGMTPLVQGLQDEEPIVRGACAWALGRYGTEAARMALLARVTHETDDGVREELEASLREQRS
jgi:epoxyqueuosine reductase